VTSPTSRSLAHLRDAGWTVAIVEHWNHYAKVKQDLFGFGDLLCVRAGIPPMLVQTTTQDNAAKRVAKILAEPRAETWLRSGCSIVVHGWAKRGGRGERKTWSVSERDVMVEEFKKRESA